MLINYGGCCRFNPDRLPVRYITQAMSPMVQGTAICYYYLDTDDVIKTTLSGNPGAGYGITAGVYYNLPINTNTDAVLVTAIPGIGIISVVATPAQYSSYSGRVMTTLVILYDEGGSTTAHGICSGALVGSNAGSAAGVSLDYTYVVSAASISRFGFYRYPIVVAAIPGVTMEYAENSTGAQYWTGTGAFTSGIPTASVGSYVGRTGGTATPTLTVGLGYNDEAYGIITIQESAVASSLTAQNVYKPRGQGSNIAYTTQVGYKLEATSDTGDRTMTTLTGSSAISSKYRCVEAIALNGWGA
jgi:hypothetical protein